MNERWLAPAKKVRRCIWLTELVTVLLLLLVYKFTGSEAVLMWLFLSMVIAALPMAGATLIVDHIELSRLGEDDEFYDAS